MLTLNQHIEIFRNFAVNHSQLNSFAYGEPSVLTNVEHGAANERLKYPILFMEAAGVSVVDNTLGRSYTFYVADILQKGNVNEQEILSDMQMICFDLLSYLKNSPPNAKVVLQKNSNLNDLVNAFDDMLAGWTITVTLEEAFQYNSCDIPLLDNIPGIDKSCPKVTIYESDGITVHELVSAGGFFVLPTPVGPCEPVDIINQFGTIIAQPASGTQYTVEQLVEIIDTIDANEVTIIDPIT